MAGAGKDAGGVANSLNNSSKDAKSSTSKTSKPTERSTRQPVLGGAKPAAGAPAKAGGNEEGKAGTAYFMDLLKSKKF